MGFAAPELFPLSCRFSRGRHSTQAKLHALFFPVFLGSFCKLADTPVEVVFLVYYPGSSILNL